MIRTILTSGITELGLSDEPQKLEKLIAFIDLIIKWNKAYNLTAIRNPEEMARLHILDSLAISPYIRGQRLIDIGTGAGLPGIPLAIYHPEMQFTLLDSNAKKTRFVQQAILELKLTNVIVQHHRVEDFKPEIGFDTVTCRAFSSMDTIMQLTAHLFNDKGLLLAMKGQTPKDELALLSQHYNLINLTVPSIDAERCLVCIET
ncbi:MAG: 16S rRNA (guanine(527)-N(7))-methyltransferase RsmG [Methylococcales bacterium]|nr:16S rRNA (guanine(527)-N(7))-methyltransferase RsmG [Methylococcales bacterium]